MDPDVGLINIEGKKLAYSDKDVEKLTNPNGCTLEVVNEKVHNLDDGSCSDQEDYYEEDVICLSEEAKLERMKREYISITLNTNRDVLSTSKGSPNSCKNRISRSSDDLANLTNFDDGYTNVHSKYKNLGSYEALIGDASKGYEEIIPGKVFKRLLIPGHGPVTTEDSLIIYNCALWHEAASEPFDSTWLRHNTLINDLSKDSLLPGLKELLLTTKNGEWCEAFFRPEMAFGPLGAPPRIPPNATIFCTLEVVKVVPKENISILSHNPREAQAMGVAFDDFITASDEARKRGNYYVEKQQFKVALQRYKSGIRILESLTYKNEDEEKRAMALLLKLYNNSAKVANAAGIPRLALSCCKQASLIDDMEPKTYWCRLNAWKIKGHPDKALGVARQALQLFKQPSTTKLFQREVESLKSIIQAEKYDSNELYRLMGRAFST